MLKDNKLFEPTKSVPMASLYGNFLENQDRRTASCVTMGYRRLKSLTTKMNCQVKHIPGHN
jgi:hypothetical protein